MSTAVQWYLTIDLSVYAPLLYFFGLFVFACGRICKNLLGLLEAYCTSTVYLRYREDSFAQNARSSLVTTDLASSLNRSRNDPSNGGDVNKKTLYYTPWNGRFLMCREEVSISCFGRSPQILKELLSECRTEYAKLWIRSVVSKTRRTLTVILDESRKTELLEDIRDFLDPVSQYLSSAIASHFGLNIYILSLSTINEANLKSLFDKLPSRCIILLEDIDASKSGSGKLSLSALLNVIDGIGLQEGRILIMTTNHITRLDEALIRPGRVDKKVELGLADNIMTADLFCLVFKPLAKEFAGNVPELKFSPAEIFSFLLEHRKSPEEAISNVEKLISKPIEAKSKPPRISEDAKPKDTRPQIAQASKAEFETEVYISNGL
ncbi:P-loop containing nucleoside triphosphate hydrolase protein [Hyaloscypha sp. PMI_1271]|nr:P-loop containing nucleoside triphosphate hydrolase protein [Hyaloscypha sp. PMI_1271]